MYAHPKNIFGRIFSQTMNRAFFVFFLTLSGLSQAQEPWTLQKCIEEGLKKSVQIRQSELNLRNQQVSLEQSKAAVLPTLNGQAANFYNVGRTIDRFTNQFANSTVQSINMGLSTQFNLFNGMQNYYNIQQNKINLAASLKDIDQSKNDISLSVASAFLNILLAREVYINNEKQVELTRQQLERTRKLFEAGATPRANLLQVEAQLANEELTVVNAKNSVDLAILALSQLLMIENREGFDISAPKTPEPDEMPLNFTASFVYSQALSNQPSLMSAELRTKSAEKGIQLSKSGLYPSLSFSGSIGTGYSGLAQKVIGVETRAVEAGFTQSGETVFSVVADPILQRTSYREQFGDNVNKSYGLVLTVPIFNNFQVRGNMSRSKIQYEQAKLNYEQTKINLKRTIEQAFADALAALNRYKATKKSVEALREVFRNTEQRFNAGAANPLEYNDSKTRLVAAESNLLQAKYDYVFRYKILDFYMGKAITL
jgi:outer membrane protein